MDKTIIIPQAKITFRNKINEATEIIIAGGRKPEVSWLKKLASNKEVYCVDKGYDYALAADLKIALVCGDGDSSENWELAQKTNKVKQYAKDKDQTDLQLALEQVPEASNLVITGIWGGRFDHLFSGIYSLKAVKKTGKAVVLADEKEVMILLQQGEQIEFEPLEKENLVVSLIPLEETNKVTIKGTKWELLEEEINQNNPYAISNILKEPSLQCICQQGFIALYLSYEV